MLKNAKNVELRIHQSSWAGESIKKLKRMDNRGNDNDEGINKA